MLSAHTYAPTASSSSALEHQQRQHAQATAQQPHHYSHQGSHRGRTEPPFSYYLAAQVSEYIQQIFLPTMEPDVDEYRVKETARRQLEALADRVSPGARLIPFGSMANGFALRNCDMDLCCFAGKDAPSRTPSELVEILGKLIEAETPYHVKMLPRARIPIIKLSLPAGKGSPYPIQCDIGFENRLALENTRLLLTYAMADPRLRPLVLFLKVWTKNRKINNPYLGTLSSYGYVLLVIFFLVHVKQPPVLPNLQRLPPLRPLRVEESEWQGRDISFFDDIEALPVIWQTSNTSNVGELLIDFFRFFSREFPYNTAVISIRSPDGLMSKETKGWNPEAEYDPESGHSRDLHKLCIEDPFHLEYNVARTVTRDGLYTIRGEFMRAARILTSRSHEHVSVVMADLCQERDEYLVAQPASAQHSPRRRSAPSPRLGPQLFPMTGSFAPSYDYRLTRATSRGYPSAQAYDATSHFSLHDTTKYLVPAGSGWRYSSDAMDRVSAARNARVPLASNAQQDTRTDSATPDSLHDPRATTPTPSDAGDRSTRERRSSWDGASPSKSLPSSAPTTAAFALHRFFQANENDREDASQGKSATSTADGRTTLAAAAPIARGAPATPVLHVEQPSEASDRRSTRAMAEPSILFGTLPPLSGGAADDRLITSSQTPRVASSSQPQRRGPRHAASPSPNAHTQHHFDIAPRERIMFGEVSIPLRSSGAGTSPLTEAPSHVGEKTPESRHQQ